MADEIIEMAMNKTLNECADRVLAEDHALQMDGVLEDVSSDEEDFLEVAENGDDTSMINYTEQNLERSIKELCRRRL